MAYKALRRRSPFTSLASFLSPATHEPPTPNNISSWFHSHHITFYPRTSCNFRLFYILFPWIGIPFLPLSTWLNPSRELRYHLLVTPALTSQGRASCPPLDTPTTLCIMAVITHERASHALHVSVSHTPIRMPAQQCPCHIAQGQGMKVGGEYKDQGPREV